MAIDIQIQIPPELLGLAARLENQEPLWRDFQVYRAEAFRQQIRDQVDAHGHPLPPLSAAYAKWKAAKHPGQPIRKLTGQTVQSYKSTVRPNGLEETLQSPSVEYMQKGTSRMPARPYFPETLPDTDRRKLEDFAIKWILGG